MKGVSKTIGPVVGFVIILALALLGSSCASVDRTVNAPPMIEGAHFTGNKACADCHTNYARAFSSTAHSRLAAKDGKIEGMAGCESCHGPGSKHIAVGGGKGKFIANPGKEPAVCLNCHLEIQAQFNLPHHHPVPEGRMNCVQCHDPHGRETFKAPGGLAMARLNQTCSECHRDQARSHVFEHEAMREGCTVCHTMHGSINPKMLVQRDMNLCIKCHAQVAAPGALGSVIFIGRTPHNDRISQSTCWAAGCHSAVHGSNANSHLRY